MIILIRSLARSTTFFFQHDGHELTGGPHATWEYVLAGISFAIVVWVFYLAVRMTFRPGEEGKDHIKRTILDDEWKGEAQNRKPSKHE